MEKTAAARGVPNRRPTIRMVDVLVPADIHPLVDYPDLPRRALHHQKLFVGSKREILKLEKQRRDWNKGERDVTERCRKEE